MSQYVYAQVYIRIANGSVTQALRLVLHSLATSAARYGRYIEPLASLSIDFYVRLFVRVKTSQAEVKKLVAYVFACVFIHAVH